MHLDGLKGFLARQGVFAGCLQTSRVSRVAQKPRSCTRLAEVTHFSRVVEAGDIEHGDR